jgi:hypothetical protein
MAPAAMYNSETIISGSQRFFLCGVREMHLLTISAFGLWGFRAASAADGKDVYLMPNITRGGKPSIKLFINSARI